MSDPKIIEAEQIVLRDAEGNVRILLHASAAGGPLIQISAAGGKTSVGLQAFPTGDAVALILRAPRRHLVLRLDETGSLISLTDGEGKHSVEIAAPLEAGAGTIHVYRDGKVIAALPPPEPDKIP